ncbi:MAG: leucine--tRNA ligase [Caldithrix sp. RBG_13_44_9]|nr:MAG: leucine--tRNA ligase [Caldithrix sp. RBG_13_44_9]
MGYPFKEIENKWRKKWEKNKAYTTDLQNTAKKCYTLVMFIYPSSDKLHLGHWFNYGSTDTWARFRRMNGYNVFEPIGFDAFGLPAENFAIKTKGHPRDITEDNVNFIRQQLKAIGAMYDWKKELDTSQPEYYQWTQWIFLQLFKAGLAYRTKAPVNWCPSCNTVLANEQVMTDDTCERCGTVVTKKNLVQWFFKITAYAERLLKGLEKLDWPERTMLMQKNWIGKSTGVEIEFKLENLSTKSFRIFTTRPDTLYGVTYMVLAPEHPLVEKITSQVQKAQVQEYVKNSLRQSEIERTSTIKEKAGVFTGAFAINPVNEQRIPIWIADYVLMSYGTGAVMAVPGHDERDFEFATHYDLPIQKVILSPGTDPDEPLTKAYVEPGIMINSGPFSGLNSEEGIEKTSDWLESKGLGQRKVNYKLRDWLISRQRYWGAPIPIIHCSKCGEVPVPEKDLPVLLPYDVDFRPTGESPLKYHEKFKQTTCPSCGEAAQREVDTMDTFVDSSWYYLRYLSPRLKSKPFDKKLVNEWCPVDMYVGGAEHATMHLLYARFITMVLHDLNFINFTEPFQALRHQGVIKGPDGLRMRKSRGNVVNPEEYLEKYGSDAFRCALMFGFEFEKGGPWSDESIASLDRFLNRVWRLFESFQWVFSEKILEAEFGPDEKELHRILHYSIKGATEDTERFHFNTAISRIMELVNGLYRYSGEKTKEALNAPLLKEVIEKLNLLLTPFAPHLAEELWEKTGHSSSMFLQSWPQYDPKALEADLINYGILINGKVRAQMEIDRNLSTMEIEKIALQSGRIPELIKGKTIRKIIVVPEKVVNIVVS